MRDKTGAASVMVRMPPVGVAPVGRRVGTTTHTSVIVSKPRKVQCRIFLECIGFTGVPEELNSLKLRDFAEVKIAHFHWGNDHFEGFFPRGAGGGAKAFDVS